MKSINLNDLVLLNLSKSGWEKLLYITEHSKYHESFDSVEYLRSRTVQIGDNIYFKEQLWIIMQQYGELFFNGSQYLQTTEILIDND